MTFKEWLKEKHLTSDYEDLAESILEDEDFPNLPQKSPNRRYLRINATYCGYTQLLLFDDLWLEFDHECLPKKITENRAEGYRRAERERIVDHLTQFVTECRTGVCDSLCDKFLDELERLGTE